MAQNVYAGQSENFWDIYELGRPKVPPSFWSRIFEYHTSHGGQYNVVNDLGSGVGIHSTTLAQHFQHVILTDPAEENLNVARTHLSSSNGNVSGSVPATNEADKTQGKFSYVVGTAEENPIPPTSLDMVFAANSMHHTQPSEALRNIASQLRPGGSAIMALFGSLPNFENPHIQAVWDRLVTYAIDNARAAINDLGLKLESQDSGLNSIAIPASLFENVRRVMLNATRGLEEPFRMAQGEKEQYPLISRVAGGEEVCYENDDNWDFDCDLDGIKATFQSYPFIGLNTRLIERFWKDMEEAAGDAGRYRGHWPCSIIMATRRAE